MKRMTQTLTALLTAGVMLGSLLPLGASAKRNPAVHTNGTFSVLWTTDDWTLLHAVRLNGNNGTDSGYLLATNELRDTLPEGSPPVKRGDILRVPEGAAIAGSINRHPKDVMGYGVCGIVYVDEDNDINYVAGKSEIIGSVFDDPQYTYYKFGGTGEREGMTYWDADGNALKQQPINYVYLKPPGFDPGDSVYKGQPYPTSCAEGTDVSWDDYQPGDWVRMLSYDGAPVFPEKITSGSFATVVAVQGDGAQAQYLLSDWNVLTQADIALCGDTDFTPVYGSILYYDPKEISRTMPADPDFDETSTITLLGQYQGMDPNTGKNLLVTGNSDGTVSLQDEDGNALSYDYGESYATYGFTDGIDPAGLHEGEVWRFATEGGQAVLPMWKISEQSDEEQPVNALIVESVSPSYCVIQSHSWVSHFGQTVQNSYYDSPFSLPTNDIVACLGDYPKVGDILHESADITIWRTELAGGVNTGNIEVIDGGAMRVGMLERTGNILDKFQPKDFTVTFGGEFPQYWALADGDQTHQYLSLRALRENVKSGDTVTFAMYYDHPAFPLPAEQLSSGMTAAVEAVGKDACVIRTGSHAFRWELSELTACLGDAPRVGDVLEITPDAQFLWERTDTYYALTDGGLYKVTPETGLVKRLCNCIDDGETTELRLGWIDTWNGHDYADMTWKNHIQFYYFYDTADYPDNTALDLAECNQNDTVIFASYQGEPMLPIRTADYMAGDLDNSGALDILDVVTINKSILGSKRLTKTAQKAADLNDDGKADADDALQLLKLVLEAQ